MAPQIANTDDQLLALLTTDQKRNALGQLFRRHLHAVSGLCLYYLKDDALSQDAVMDIFEGILKNIHKYEIVNFKGWLLTYTRNHCLKQLTRGIKKENELFDKNYDLQNVESIDNEDHIDDDRYIQLEEALDELKAHQRECVSLFYLKGQSYQDIVEVTGYTPNEVKSYIQNGKKNLKKKLSLTQKE